MIPVPGLRAAGSAVARAAATGRAAGTGVLRLLAAGSVATGLTAVAAVTAATALAGLVVTGQVTAISHKSLQALLVAAVIAGLAGFAVAVLAARQVSAASRLLQAAVREAGRTGQYHRPPAVLPAELAALSAELAAAHGRLAGATDRERTADAGRRELVAGVSHDLRAPVAGLRGMAGALEDDTIAGQQAAARCYGQIRAETERLTLMIDDLLKLSCIHAGALRLSRHPAGLGDLIAEALDSAGPLARARSVNLGGYAAASPPVYIDAAEVGRALRNLIIHAIGHTPADGSVEVLGGEESGTAIVSVSDSCGGIPAGRLPAAYDMAFRGDAARAPWPGESPGLGLSIARGIVEAHAGQLGVRNAGIGCQFVIRLPLAPAAGEHRGSGR